jgi:hypothetical protein
VAIRPSSERVPIWLWISIALAVLCSLYSIVRRHQVEARNKAVAISAEYEMIEALAASQGLSIDQAFEKLKAQGLNSVVLSEQTLGDLVAAGAVDIRAERTPGNPKFSLTYIEFIDSNQYARVKRALDLRFPPTALASGERVNFSAPRLTLRQSVNLARSTAIGLNPDQVAKAKAAGLMIVGRYGNPQGLAEQGVRETIRWATEQGVFAFLAMGDQVLGRRDSVSTTIEALKEAGILYATPEFTKIGGDANIVAAAPEIVVRLHSAQVAELDKMPLIDAVERYGRAARERNMRILLLRPVSFSSAQPLNGFADFIKEVNDQIHKEGGDIGTPKPFEEPQVPRWWPVLVALCAMPAVWFAISQFFEKEKVRIGIAVILGLLALAAITKTGSQLAAFAASLGFPTLGYILLDKYRPKSIIVGFLLVSALSFAGALCIPGLLNGLSYYVQADEFRGVKLSVFLPILLVGAFFFMKLVDWRGTLSGPITWGTAGLGFVILALLAFLIARTGNDTGAGASGTELIMRNVLDRFLYVRPRTKEFMIGHPLLVIGIGMLSVYYALREKLTDNPGLEPRVKALGGWTTLILMVSAMGQTGIVNTLSHIHIPVLLSIARVGIGLVIGCIIGLALWSILSRAALRVDR